MVDLTPVIPADRQVIDSYGPGWFRISGIIHRGAVLVFPDRSQAWPVAGFEGLSLESFAALDQAQPPIEVLLLGCGPRMQLLPAALRQRLKQSGIVADPMATGPACRTYNVLLAEGRRVAAALLPA
ncbi:MAG: Mth938-like domain-containing protein [Azospirillaceae bacterium]|nr:Mth938-like domain-containing protein [Azospirillaceae bacterium]